MNQTSKQIFINNIVSGVKGFVASIAIFSIGYVSFVTIPTIHAEAIVVTPGGGQVWVWIPCCNGVWFYTNPAVEGPIQSKLPHVLDPVTAAMKIEGWGAKSELGLIYPLPLSLTKFNEVPLAGVCAEIAAECIPLPAAGLITTIYNTPPTIGS